ncbi:hypothetical protein TNCV_1384111 [Trichonephila clavipes]|nr:hypothetical protein TNCV_1384111 [Trichonephila clavipes]
MKIRSEYLPFRTQVLYRARQNDRLRLMFGTSLYRYHTPTPVIRRIVERTIPYSWRACEQLRHFVGCVIMRDGLFTSVFDGLVAFAVDRWRHDCGA